MRTSVICACLILFFGALSVANAASKSTSFQNMMKQSEHIAVAKLVAIGDSKSRQAEIDVLKVLKGTLKPGKQTIAFADSPSDVAVGDEVVVFLDEKLAWRFVAKPLKKGDAVERAALSVFGFYNWNAHFVWPGLVTLDQLAQYLKDGSLKYQFQGEVYFPQPGKPKWQAGTLKIFGTYDAIAQKSVVTGLPALAGLPEQPELNLRAAGFVTNDGTLQLTYSRSSNRELELQGNVSPQVGKDGELLCQFAVTGPEILTEEAFREYLHNAHLSGSVTTFKLLSQWKDAAEKRGDLSLVLGKQTKDDSSSNQLLGWEPDPLRIFAMQFSTPDRNVGYAHTPLIAPPMFIQKELDRQDGILRLVTKSTAGDYVILEFNIDGKLNAEGDFTWSFRNELRYLLYARAITGTIKQSDGKALTTVGTFTTEFDSVGFNRNDRDK